MKYMLLIHQGTTPTPGHRRRGTTLSDDEQDAVYADYKAINETPGVTPGVQMQPPETATTVRVEDGRTLTTDGPFVETKEALGGYLLLRGRRPRRRDRARRADPGGPASAARSRSGRSWSGSDPRAGLPRRSGAACSPRLIGFLGDFDLAEEAAQEAFAIAAERWPRDGVPDNPARLAGDDGAQPRHRPHPPRPHAGREDPPARRCRRRAGGRRWTTTTFPDERLELIFTCCHPALAIEAQVALTLRTLGGLTHRRDRPRLPGARADDGPAAGAGQAQDQGRRHPVPRAARPPAARPARRRAGRRLPDLQRGLRRPRRPGRRGALARAGAGRADARRARGARPAGADAAARRPPRGALRATATWCCSPTRTASLWDADQIAEGRAALDRALALRGRGPYVVQAAIASLHADEPRDWRADRRPLRRARPPHRLAGRRAEPGRRRRRGRGPGGRAARSSTGLDLDDYRYLHSTRGELLRRLGRPDEARDAYRRALELVHDDAERRLLERRLAELG